MNHEIKELVNKAIKIIKKTGTKYPNNLKKIVISSYSLS